MRTFFKYIFYGFLTFVVSSVVTVAAYRWLPVPITPLMVIRCVQNIGNGESAAIHHEWVSLKKISPYLPVAVMASEDQNFLHHHGFDFDAIQSAAMERLEGKRLRGGSTISQQTAKNVFLWPGRSWTRKGFEAYFTAMIELLWSKQRIMEVYLNSIEMGEGIYGADAVAKYHFGKKAMELSRSECALVAATLPNPRKFDSGNPNAYMRARRGKIEHEMQFIPTFPKEGEDINPETTKGGIYHRRK